MLGTSSPRFVFLVGPPLLPRSSAYSDRVGPPIQASTCIPHRFALSLFWTFERERGEKKHALFGLFTQPNPTQPFTKPSSYSRMNNKRFHEREIHFILRDDAFFQTRIWNLNLRIEVETESMSLSTLLLWAQLYMPKHDYGPPNIQTCAAH